MINKKGQGTIEYLVIIAIVIVIALVVVGLLLQVMDQGSAIPEQTAKIAWQSATPWAIVDWSQTDTNLTIILKNNTYETMDFNQIRVNSLKSPIEFNKSISAGSTHKVTVPITTIQVGSGKNYSYQKGDIIIDYNRGTISNRTQYGAADIVGTQN